MALFKLITKLFKKIGKLFGGKKGKDKGADLDQRPPGERRIGIYGPSAVGKSVFFTMLYQACRNDREFNLNPEDQETGRDLLNHLNTLRAGEWLAGTVEESELNFKAKIRGGRQFPFSTKDYKGEMVDLEQESSAREELIAYFRACDAILFLLSPEMIADPAKCEREIVNFTAMINQVTESSGKGLRIPVGLMITKADSIPGFENDTQSVLIARSREYLKAKSFADFVDGVCEQFHIKRNIVFQEQVRGILQSLSLFFDFLMTLSMDFQVFFQSSVGHVRTEETADGRTVTRPPENPQGIGVKKPFLWVVDTIRERERIAKFNAVRRFVFSLTLLVVVIYSLAYGLHLLRAAPEPDLAAPVNRDTAEQLEAYAYDWRTGFNGFFPLPGVHARDVVTDARRLHSEYAARLFLDRQLKGAAPEMLPVVLDTFTNYQSALSYPWFKHLTGAKEGQLKTILAYAIADHNLATAREVEALYGDYLSDMITPRSQAAERCSNLRDGLLKYPEGTDHDISTPYHEELQDRADIIHRICIEDEAVGNYLQQWQSIQSDLVDLCVGSPDVASFRSYLATIAAFSDSLAQSGQPELAPTQREVGELQELIRRFIDAVTESEEQRQALLRRVRAGAGDYPVLKRYAERQLAGEERAAQQSELQDLATEITSHVDNDDWSWFMSNECERTVRGLDWLTDAGQIAARQQYLDNLELLRDQGAPLTMAVVLVPEKCVVVVADPRTGQWGDAGNQQASIPFNWILGEPVKLAVHLASEPNPVLCPPGGLREPIMALHNKQRPLPNTCEPDTRGDLQVEFVDLQELVEDRLVDPLQDAFAE